jgi:hypothetical protein
MMSPAMRVDPTVLLAAMVAFITQLVVFFRWIYRKMRDDEINRAFVRDVARNHLPHVYHVLKLLCESEGIEVTEPPQIQFIDFRNSNGKRH